MATPKQVKFIEDLCGHHQGAHRIPLGLLARYHGCDNLEDMSTQEASALIDSLRDPDQRAAIRERVLSLDMDPLL